MLLRVLSAPVLPSLREEVVEPEAWEQVEVCPVCARREHLRDIARIQAEGPGATLAVCLDCEHYFKSRRPAAAWLDAFYAGEWDGSGRRGGPKPVRPRWSALDFCAEFLKPGSKVLEIGAGFGHHSLAFKRAGHDVVALEASHHRAGFIRDRLGIDCLTAPFEAAELTHDFDLLFSNHVLEHVTDPSEVVSRAASLLRPGALWYCEVPNVLSSEFPAQFLHFVPHQSGFTTRSLSRLLTRHGFHVLKVEDGMNLRLVARRLASNGESLKFGANLGGFGEVEARAREWLRQGLGRKPGQRLLAWWIAPGGSSKQKYFESAVVAGGQLGSVFRRARRAYRYLPPLVSSPLKRVLPASLYIDKVYMLEVEADASDSPGEPLVVRYDRPEAPVWIK